MIHVKVTRSEEGVAIGYTINIELQSVEIFKLLIHRGLNCWEDAPKELKDLGDMFTHGRITQDHHKQPINSKPESNPELGTPAEIHRCREYTDRWGHAEMAQRIIRGEAHLVAAGKWNLETNKAM
jgi:hypothetical protein